VANRPCRRYWTSTHRHAGATTRCSGRKSGKPYADLLAQGWTDAIRHIHPKERIYTFWKYWRSACERDAGLRIDHILLSPALAPWLSKASVPRSPRGLEHTTGHGSVIIEIEPPSD